MNFYQNLIINGRSLEKGHTLRIEEVVLTSTIINKKILVLKCIKKESKVAFNKIIANKAL
jgi:hypothetical protein